MLYRQPGLLADDIEWRIWREGESDDTPRRYEHVDERDAEEAWRRRNHRITIDCLVSQLIEDEKYAEIMKSIGKYRKPELKPWR